MSDITNKLREAKALIERGWVQGVDATDANGNWAAPESEIASCWCMSGAVYAVAGGGGATADAIGGLLNKVTGARSYVTWNDAEKRTQAEVLAAFDTAIELAEVQP